MRVHAMRRCGVAHFRLRHRIAIPWGAITSNHAQKLVPVFHPAAVGCAKSQASEEGGMPAEELQQIVLCQQDFVDPTRLLCSRQSKSTPCHPNFRRKSSKWLDNRPMPALVGSQPATLAEAMKKPFECVSTSPQRQGGVLGRLRSQESHFEIRLCRNLCEDGWITDAVDVLDRLVQRGCRLRSTIFYLILKRCIALKDLVLGKRVHALSIRSGYEGDAFLATHLISLYAVQGRLEEATRVFSKVSTPDAYNWATIIFAYARHGEAAHAIRLYRQMRESTTLIPTNRIYVAVLKACAAAEDLDAGRDVQSHILASPTKPDSFVQTGLVNMYAKCRNLEYARMVFDKIQQRDVVAWTAMIAGYARQGMGREALALYRCMQQEGTTSPNSITFACLLQACASLGVEALLQGKKFHAQIEGRGFQDDVVLGGSLVNMYAKCGSLQDARSIFDTLPDRNIVIWNVMLAGYIQQGMAQEALTLYNCMQKEMISSPDAVTFVCLLQACASMGVAALHLGKHFHAQIEEQGLQNDLVLGGSLINMYTKCNSTQDARCIFDRLQSRDVVTWTAMIAGYAQQGMGAEALWLYSMMQQEGIIPPDSITFVSLLQACASVGAGALLQGKQLHAQIEDLGLQDDVVLGGSLVNMYAKCGSIWEAHTVLDRLPNRNVVTWTTIVAGYVQLGMGQEALRLYREMRHDVICPLDSVVLGCLLHACASIGVGALHLGKQLNAQIEEQGLQDDVFLGASLVDMYAKCGSTEDARIIFDRLPVRDVVAWNSMLAGYVLQGMGQEALTLYNGMQEEGLLLPDSFTVACLLQACASMGPGALHQGRHLHSKIEERGLQDDIVVGSSLISMHAKCGSVEDALIVFQTLPQRDVVTWNAMIGGYAQQEMGLEAFTLYSSMQQEGIAPTYVTFVCLLEACAVLAALPLGSQLHADIEKQGLQADLVVGTALVNMYAKCGSMIDAHQVFDSLPERTIEAWGALMAGYSYQGDSEFVFVLLDRMILEGIEPDGILFLSVLSVCSHVGLVDKGRRYFEVMRRDYGISPTVEHYTCMTDLLGRAGHLDEALEVANSIPFAPDGAVWRALLGACRKWNNVEIGRHACEFAVSVDGEDASSNVVMANIYASSTMWEEARTLNLGAWKKPGHSWWTDMGGVVHTFVVGDKTHPESDGICASH